ncbi:hypothetical protein FMN50_14225 [Rhodobacterales bacterium]|nr:hypothetical protein FMN50_14225 [Rhodobacterales bacterium]
MQMPSAVGMRVDSNYDLRAQSVDGEPDAFVASSRGTLAFPGTLNIVLLTSVIISTVFLCIYTGPEIGLISSLPYVFIISTCLALSIYIRRRSAFSELFVERMQLILKGVVFIFVALATLRIFNHLTMNLSFPLADPLLNSWDKALGLNWMAYFRFVQNNPPLATLLDVAYIGFDGASLLGFLALVVMGYFRRARYFCEIFLVTAAVATVIAMFFPAVAAVVFNFGNVSHLQGFSSAPGIYHIEQLTALRVAETPSINLLTAQGLATFPSFHAAGGILLIAGFLRTRLFFPVAAFSLTMLASVPVFGGHYFVDVLAGTALALTVSFLNACRPCYHGLFGADPAYY